MNLTANKCHQTSLFSQSVFRLILKHTISQRHDLRVFMETKRLAMVPWVCNFHLLTTYESVIGVEISEILTKVLIKIEIEPSNFTDFGEE